MWRVHSYGDILEWNLLEVIQSDQVEETIRDIRNDVEYKPKPKRQCDNTEIIVIICIITVELRCVDYEIRSQNIIDIEIRYILDQEQY